MLEDGKITAAQAADAKSKPIELNLQKDPNSLAPHYVEEIRRYLEAKYGSDQVHEGGLRVYTSLDTDLQKAARQALLDGLAVYERRHGWRGRLVNVVAHGEELDKYLDPDWDEEPGVNGYMHALVTDVSVSTAAVRFGRYTATLSPADVAWANLKMTNLKIKKKVSLGDILEAGDIVYVKVLSLDADGKARVSLEQDSGAEGALVAIDNATGEIKAMVGGRDFESF